MKKIRIYVSCEGTLVQTSDNSEIKRLKACDWQERKTTKQVYAKGLENGNSF